VICATSLILSYLSVYVSPASWWMPAFFGLAFPVLIIVNFLFAIYWALRRRFKLLIFNAVILLLGVSYITDFIQFRTVKDDVVSEDNIKILSYNVKLFDLYNWSDNIDARDKIFDIVKEENADIICFQEFYKETIDRFKTLDTIIQFQDAKHYHEQYSKIIAKKYSFVTTKIPRPVSSSFIFPVGTACFVMFCRLSTIT